MQKGTLELQYREFSTHSSMSHNNSHRLLGSILLIIGCCIGAGMLGLPVITATAGFVPTALIMVLCALFMATTALLVLEATLWFGSHASLISMAQQTLGWGGSLLTWLLFLFLFYCLGIAYTTGSGVLVGGAMTYLIGPFPHPQLCGALVATFITGLLIYAGTGPVDYLNRLLIIGLVASYSALIAVGAAHINGEQLLYHSWSATFSIVPILLISFGFHNMIPSLTHYTDYDVGKMCKAIGGGTLGALLIYFIWEIVILGILPPPGSASLAAILDQGEMVTHQLSYLAGGGWVLPVAHAFAFFAIVSSNVANSLSFVDFLADGLKITSGGVRRLFLCFLVLLPPLIVAFLIPNLFLKALHLAGATATVILFGIMPALIVGIGRRERPGAVVIVPGGTFTLSIVIAVSLAVLALEIGRHF